MTTILIIGACVIAFLMAIGFIVCAILEQREWNGGYCRDCNTQWRLYHVDTDGERLYTCQCNETHTCTVSSNIDSKQ